MYLITVIEYGARRFRWLPPREDPRGGETVDKSGAALALFLCSDSLYLR